MQCPSDQTTMEEGFLFANGQKWKKGKPGLAYKLLVGKAFGETSDLTAFRCPKCGEVKIISKN